VTVGVQLPATGGTLVEYRMRGPVAWPRPTGPITSRTAFAAGHVAADPFANNVPGAPARLDWDATLAFRRHLWSYGLGVAEAMDTAQRGMGLDWPAARELIDRSSAEAKSVGGRIAAGAGTDHRPNAATLAAVRDAYLEQVAHIEGAGAQVIIMASRELAAIARGPEDYAAVYGPLLAQTSQPVILHWLGPMFDPELAGYWGSSDIDVATKNMLDLITQHRAAVNGVKISLLDADHERGLRASLPDGVHVYTGDDFNYVELIRGDGVRASDALLGIFAAIAPAASSALQALDRNDLAAYEAALAPTVALSRHLFQAPTYYYKAGIAFLAWICGYQRGFAMVGGLQSARSAVHLAEAFRLADQAGLLPDSDLAAGRLTSYLSIAGVLG
jgi:Protein of unknown function (DUF993)